MVNNFPNIEKWETKKLLKFYKLNAIFQRQVLTVHVSLSEVQTQMAQSKPFKALYGLCAHSDPVLYFEHQIASFHE